MIFCVNNIFCIFITFSWSMTLLVTYKDQICNVVSVKPRYFYDIEYDDDDDDDDDITFLYCYKAETL